MKLHFGALGLARGDRGSVIQVFPQAADDVTVEASHESIDERGRRRDRALGMPSLRRLWRCSRTVGVIARFLGTRTRRADGARAGLDRG